MQQRSVPQVGTATRMIVLSLLVAIVLAMALVAAQLATRPAPAPVPEAPMRFGPSGGPARPM